jgi:ribosome-binding protein aMBF1 (putative translation factor)
LEAANQGKSKNAFDPGRKQLYKNTVYFQSALLSPEHTMATSAMNLILEHIALFQFTPTHCVQARAMLGWSVEQLSREAQVSVEDIQRFEAQQDVADAARLALAYRLEAQGLVFFPGFAPGRKLNPQAMQQNAVERGDFAQVG